MNLRASCFSFAPVVTHMKTTQPKQPDQQLSVGIMICAARASNKCLVPVLGH